jgi:hypothetical protein
MTRLWVVGFLLLLVGCSNASATDPALIGTWESEATLEGRKWTFVFDIKQEGEFTFTSNTRDGTFVAKNGQWRVSSQKGFSDGGAYSFPSTDSISMTGKYGTGILTRTGPGDTSRGSRVDPAVVGQWQTTFPLDGKETMMHYTFTGHGSYELELITEDGDYEAKDGKWKSVSKSGHVEEGQYVFVNENSVSISGPKGTTQWKRSDSTAVVIEVGDKSGQLALQIKKNIVGSTMTSWDRNMDNKTVTLVKNVKSQGVKQLVIIERKDTCLMPDCAVGHATTSDMILELDKVQLTSIEVHHKKRSTRTDWEFEHEGRAVGFRCIDDQPCWGKFATRGWIVCRDKSSCVNVANDLKALIRLAKKQSASLPIAKVKDRPKDITSKVKCGQDAMKLVPDMLRDIRFNVAKWPVPWRSPKNRLRVKLNRYMDEYHMCGKGIQVVYGRDVTAEIHYAIFNTYADALKRDKVLQEKGFDSRLLKEHFFGVTTTFPTLSDEDKKIVVYCMRPKKPDPNQLLRVVCINAKPSSQVQIIVKGDFLAGTQPDPAIRVMEDLLHIAVKYYAQAVLRTDFLKE